MESVFRPNELQAVWRVLSRAALPIIATVVLTSILTYVFSKLQTPVYQASARVLAAQSASLLGSSVPNSAPLDAETYREAALGTTVLTNAARTLKLSTDSKTLQQLQRILNARAQRGESFLSSTITINARSDQPAQAAKIANVVADALKNWDNERVRDGYSRHRKSLETQLQGTVAEIQSTNDKNRQLALRSLQGSLLRDLDLVRALELTASGQLSILDAAIPPLQAIAPRPLLNALLAGLFVLAISLFTVVLRDNFTRAIHGSDELTELTGLPVLGEFPKMLLKSRDLPVESASYLRAQLSSIVTDSPKMFAITSPNAEEGKSSVGIALARAFARTNKNTLLIDLDLRRPVLAKEFGVTSYPDIMTLIGDASSRLRTYEVAQNLHLLPCIEPVTNALEPVMESFPALLRRIVETQFWEVIVIDTPPLLEVSDALAFVEYMSGVVVCVSEGTTQRQRLVSALNVLGRVGAKVVGAVVTNAREAKTLSTFGGKYSYRQKKPTLLSQDDRI